MSSLGNRALVKHTRTRSLWRSPANGGGNSLFNHTRICGGERSPRWRGLAM